MTLIPSIHVSLAKPCHMAIWTTREQRKYHPTMYLGGDQLVNVWWPALTITPSSLSLPAKLTDTPQVGCQIFLGSDRQPSSSLPQVLVSLHPVHSQPSSSILFCVSAFPNHFIVGIFLFTPCVVFAQVFSGFLLEAIVPYVAVDSVCPWEEVSSNFITPPSWAPLPSSIFPFYI